MYMVIIFYMLWFNSISISFKKNNIIKSRISSYFHLNIRVLSRFYNQIKIEKNSFATSEIDEFQKEGTIFIPSALEKKLYQVQ